MREETRPVKKCITCGKELQVWKRLFCSDICSRKAREHLKLEGEFVKSEIDLANEVIKLQELLGEKKVLLDEMHQQLVEEFKLQMIK